MMFGILAVALLAQNPTPPPPIVGGEATKEGEYPGVVAVVVNQQLCAATVVSPKVLVTAAHCFSRAKPDTRVTVHQGISIHDARLTSSQKWGLHPLYCGKEDCKDDSFDYAYIQLQEPIELEEYPRPLTSQAEYDLMMRSGQPITLVGYGEDDEGNLGKKHHVNTSIASFSLKGRLFVTSGEGRDSCRGDSGGPALAQDSSGERLWLGVLSSGAQECGKGGYYGVPLPILSWLKNETGYDPGGCLSENCLRLTKESPTDDVPSPNEGGCSARVTHAGPSPWAFSVLLLTGLGRLRSRRSRGDRSKTGS